MKPMKASDFFDPELLYLKRPDVSYARKLVELYELHLIWKSMFHVARKNDDDSF